MTATSHGHHIAGSSTEDDSEIKVGVSCGGPGLCAQCSREAWLHVGTAPTFYEDKEGNTIVVPEGEKPEEVAADIQAAETVVNQSFVSDRYVEDGTQSDILKQALEDKEAAEARQAEEDALELDLEHQLASLLNRHSAENESGTPDYILAEYLLRCLVTFNETVKARAIWRGEEVRLHGDIHDL